MIARLRGTVAALAPDRLVLDVNGVGYEVYVPARTARVAREDAALTLWVHTAVREDAITLYGFADPAEKATFDVLLGVNQVGPKLALSVLGALTPAELGRAVEGNDLRTLAGVPGVGKKTAERLVLELRGKLAWSPAPPAPKAADDALPLALAQLGYKKSEIDAVITKLAERGKGEAPLQERLSLALALLAAK